MVVYGCLELDEEEVEEFLVGLNRGRGTMSFY